MYQHKETMKTGINISNLYNLNKEMISKIGHLSIPIGLYTNKTVRGIVKNISDGMNVSVIDLGDKDATIEEDVFSDLLSITTSRDKMKTRKNKHIAKKSQVLKLNIKINTEKGEKRATRKRTSNTRNNTKKRNTKRTKIKN